CAELRHVLRIEDLAALDVELTGDLEAVEVALAVPHDLVWTVPFFFRIRGLPVAGVYVLRRPADGAAEGEVGLKHLLDGSDRSLLRVHQAGRRRGRRTETAIEVGVLDGQSPQRPRMESAGPVRVEHGAEGIAPLARRTERPVVGIRKIQRPGRQLRMVQPCGDLVREQTALEKGLRGQGELPAAVAHHRAQAELLRHIPDDLLEEAYEALFVEPGERHGLDAVLENLRVHSEADDEGLATALAPFTPMEDQILPLHVPLVDVPLELRLREQAGRIALPAQRPVLLAQGARDLPLRPQ